MLRIVFIIFMISTHISCTDNDILPTADAEIKTREILIGKKGIQETPTRELLPSEVPDFLDHMDFKNMDIAIKRQLAAFERRALSGHIQFGEKVYPYSVLKKTILRFQALMEKRNKCMIRGAFDICNQQFKTSITEEFDLYTPVSKGDSEVHFTAYYSPILEGVDEPHPDYPFAIYRKPKTGTIRTLTRNQIDYQGMLKGKGYDFFYLKNPFDVYLLHIEGGGVIRTLDDNGKPKLSYISYEGHNSNKFSFISKYMVERNYISNHSVAMQREFIENNPDKWEEIFSYCKGYIYFKKSKTEPLGMENIPLTEQRSIAQDRTYYPRKGILTFVMAEKPYRDQNGNIQYEDYQQFYIDQDTGSKIRGGARADIYFGYGEEAELAANTLNTKGHMVFLVAK